MIPVSHDREMTLNDGRDVLVDYTVEDYGSEPSGMYGSPENYDPGSGPIIGIDKITIDGIEIEIDEAERYRLEDILVQNPDWWVPEYDGPDYDPREDD